MSVVVHAPIETCGAEEMLYTNAVKALREMAMSDVLAIMALVPGTTRPLFFLNLPRLNQLINQ